LFWHNYSDKRRKTAPVTPAAVRTDIGRKTPAKAR